MKCRVILFPEAETAFKQLIVEAERSKIHQSILKAVRYKMELIKQDSQYGSPIGKNKLPKEYAEKYGITNLFRVELPSYWRMLYSVTNNDSHTELTARIIDISSHPEYDDKMGYRKK